MDWYEYIEPEVRELVRKLRNNGINTCCSCGHKMYIECENYDYRELDVIYNTLAEMNYHHFRITLEWYQPPEGVSQKIVRIKLPTQDGCLDFN